jgi:hypothetical protein
MVASQEMGNKKSCSFCTLLNQFVMYVCFSFKGLVIDDKITKFLRMNVYDILI